MTFILRDKIIIKLTTIVITIKLNLIRDMNCYRHFFKIVIGILKLNKLISVLSINYYHCYIDQNRFSRVELLAISVSFRSEITPTDMKKRPKLENEK